MAAYPAVKLNLMDPCGIFRVENHGVHYLIPDMKSIDTPVAPTFLSAWIP